MSLKWPNKDPDEILDYSIDWSRFLSGASLSSVTWFVDDADGVKTAVSPASVVNGLQMVQQTNTSSVSTIRFSLGTNNIRYRISCKITTTEGLQYERSVFLRVKEK